MRYKVAPDPVDEETLRAVHEAVPLVPATVDDCCARVVERTAVRDRDAASDWLGFLTALELVRDTDRGYERIRRSFEIEDLGAAFRERVFAVPPLLDALRESEAPVTETDAFAAIEAEVPTWERNRHNDWQAVWRTRSRRLLDWAVVFGLARRVGDGYGPRS